MIPPSRVPVAPPAPFIAPHRPIARWRSGPGANEEVITASDAAAMIAPPRPCSARAPTSISWVCAAPPMSEASANMSSPVTNVRRLAEQVGGTPAEHQKSGERDRVGVDDPLQVRVGEAEARVDRRQRDVDDRDIEDDHELRQATQGQQQRVARRGMSLRRGGGRGGAEGLSGCGGCCAHLQEL